MEEDQRDTEAAADAGAASDEPPPPPPPPPAAPSAAPTIAPAAVAGDWTYPDLESAIKKKAASFTQVAETAFYSKPEFQQDEARRRAYERYVGPIIGAFENRHGPSEHVYYASNVVAAVAMTIKPGGKRMKYFTAPDDIRLHVVNNENRVEDVEILALMNDCQRLATDARAYIDGQDLFVCIDDLYGILANCILLMEIRKTNRDAGIVQKDDALIREQRRQFAETRRTYVRAAQRDAQLRYFGGMVAGFVAVVLAMIPIAGINWPGRDLYADAAIVSGGVGAIVSVLTRMGRGTLKLRFETGDWYIRLLGGVRPMIGATFGLFLYFAVASTVLSLKTPDNDVKTFFFYAVIAFIAGFSERWAQDMLSVSRKAVTPTAKDDESPDATARTA